MARKQYETKFIAELKKSVAYYYPNDSFWYKIPDDMIYSKPFDVFASFGDKHYALEMKVHRSHTAWPLGKLQKHQADGLLKALRGGYRALVLIQVIYKTDKIKKNFVSILTVNDIFDWARSGKKSVTSEELEMVSLTKKRVAGLKTSLWDIDFLA